MDKALSTAGQTAINNPGAAIDVAKEVGTRIYDNAQANANAYNVSRTVARMVTGVVLAPLGGLAGVGDITYGIEQGRTTFEEIVRNAAYGTE